MKLAVSNIAWCDFEDAAIARVLSEHHVSKIEAAPAALAKQPTALITDKRIDEVCAWWHERGFSIPAFQALLFGYPEFQLFGTNTDRENLLDFFKYVIGLAERCGTRNLVFGSPKNRLRNGLSQEAANGIAVEFFAKVGALASPAGCVVCLEPNASGYGCDFLTHLGETADIVKQINNTGVGLQLDTGVMLMNSEQPEAIRKISSSVSHVHCSQPFLEALSQETMDFHKQVALELIASGYSGFISIEMKRASETNNEKHIEKAVKFAQQAYASIL